MENKDSQLSEILTRVYSGDQSALERLMEDHYPWILQKVRQRMGPGLRARMESVDIVQDAMVKLVDYGPRVVTDDVARFRALTAKIIENTLRDKNDFLHAQKRAISRERELGPASRLDASPVYENPERASVIAMKGEDREVLHIALLCLDPEDQEVIHLKLWEGLDWAEIGRNIGVEADAARMRFNRAIPKLHKTYAEITAK